MFTEPPPKRARQRSSVLQPRFLIGVVVSLAFLAWLFRDARIDQVWGAILAADMRFLTLALVLALVALWLRALRWYYLLAPFKRIPTTRLFPVLTIGYMANSLLPARAGEIYRAYAIGRREKVDKATVLAGIVLERVFDGLVLLAMLVVALAMAPFDAPWLADLVRFTVLVFLGTLGVLVALVARPAWTLWLSGWLLRGVPARFRPLAAALVEGFLDGLRVLARPGLMAAVTITSVLGWLVDVGLAYLVLWAFGVTAPPHLMLIDMAAANLGTSVPASVGGIGPFEFFAAKTLELGGLDATIAAAFALVMHFIFILPVVLLGAAFLWLSHLRRETD